MATNGHSVPNDGAQRDTSVSPLDRPADPQQSNPSRIGLDYASMPIEELRARFAVRCMGWSWWRYCGDKRDDKLAALYPPEPRTKWNWGPTIFEELEDEWPEGQYSGGTCYLYDDNYRTDKRQPERALMPTFLLADGDSFRAIGERWHNYGRIVEALRDVASVDYANRVDSWRVIVIHDDCREGTHRHASIEHAALVAALQATEVAP